MRGSFCPNLSVRQGVGRKQNDRTTYAGILHYTKLSRGCGWSVVRESPLLGLKVTGIGRGNTTDYPISNRDLVATNKGRESRNRDEHKAKKHFERGTKGLPTYHQVSHTLYYQLFADPTTRND